MRDSPFHFTDVVNDQSVVLVRLPAGISSKEQLFDALSVGLSFPGYFGHNWDALEELVRDFHWLPDGRITISHEDLPRLDAQSLSIYLDILKGAVMKWSDSSKCELWIVFPKCERRRILEMISDDPSPRGKRA